MREKYHRFESLKTLAHADKIRAILRNEFPAPVEWVIYPSNVCGYRCPHCIMSREKQEHQGLLPRETMWKIPVDVKEYGIKCVIFSGGGDPLLNPETVSVARHLKGMGVQVGLNNQGYLLEEPEAFSFVRYSVDAGCKETYEKIHGFDGWERVERNILHHQDVRVRGEKVEMGLAFLVTPWNWEEVELFVSWARRFDPDFIHIRPAYLDADYLTKEYPGGAQALKDEIIPGLRERAKHLEATYDNVFFRADKFEGFWTPKQYSQCRATPLMAVTSGDGAFLICQDRGISSTENHLRWGNYNTQSFGEIWGSQEHRDAIKAIRLEQCPRCVMNGANEIIEKVFIEDSMRINLI